MKKKIISCSLVFLFILSIISVDINYVKAASIPTFQAHSSYSDWSGVDETYTGTSVTGDAGSLFDQIRSTLPASTRAIEYGKRFNYYLWFDKHIVVYGKPTNVPDGKQTFISATQIAVGNVVNDKGYYRVGSEKGEYRYHGYTKDGGFYTNINFPDDATSTTELANKRWYQTPWSNAALISSNKPTQPSGFNAKASENSSLGNDVKNWINTGVPFAITKYWDPSGAQQSIQALDKYNFMYVQSPPTKAVSGEGRMWHKTVTRTWYDTIPIPAIQPLYPGNALCALTVTYPQGTIKYPKRTGKASIDDKVKGEVFKVRVKVSGEYDDSAYYSDPVARTTYYTRDDIASWELTLQVNNGTVSKKTGSDVNTTDKNAKSFTYFDISVTTQQLWDAGGDPAKLPLKGSAQCSFKSQKGDKSGIGYANGYIDSTIKNDATIDMDFFGNVDPQVQVVDGTKDEGVWVAFNAEVLNYTNASNIKSWYMEADFGGTKVTPKTMSGGQLGINNNFGFSVSKSKFLPNSTYRLPIKVTVKVVLNSKVNGISQITKSKTFSAIFKRGTDPTYTSDTEEIQKTTESNPPPVFVDAKPYLPTPAFDIEPYTCSDATDMSTVSEASVNVAGHTLTHNAFFNGTFVFGDNNTGFQPIKINYKSTDGFDATYSTFIYVYSTKPHANVDVTGRSCINRKLTFTADTVSAIAPKVLAKYPITSYAWTVTSNEGKASAIKISGNLNSSSFTALFKEIGQYTATLVVTNAAGKTSEVISYPFYIFDDTPPGMAIGLKNSVVSRGESVSAYAYDISSADGDIIATTSIELWYDSDNNGTYDQLKQSWSNPTNFPIVDITQLGSYRFIVKATEEFGQETISTFVTSGDRKSTTRNYDVLCDNLIPMSGVFIEKPIIRPKVDMFIMMDAGLNNAKTSWITDNRVNIINEMGYNNVIANVQHWDMHTYNDTQNVSFSVDYGTAYPDASRWYDSGGYSGTIPRISVTPRTEWATRTVTRNVTTTKTFNGSRSNTRSFTVAVNKNAPIGGSWGGLFPSTSYYYSDAQGYTGTITGSWTLNPASASSFDIGVWTQTASITYSGTVSRSTAPKTKSVSVYKSDARTITVTGTPYISSFGPWSVPEGVGYSYEINQEGYVGSIPRIGETYSPNQPIDPSWYSAGTYMQAATALYSGELSKTETITEIESYSYTIYTGNYSGTVSKPYRQAYFDPYLSSSDKYLIYVSDAGISQINDFNAAKSKSDAKIVLIGSNAIASQTSYDKFILNDGSKTIDKLISEAEDYVLSKYSLINKYTFTINEDTFELKNDDVDAENDPIVEGKYQYVQNPSYFDNNLGYDSLATSSLSDTGWVSTAINKFIKPGEYKVYRRIKDRPTSNTSFLNFSYYSGTPYMIMYAQRRPIASATLDWDFNAVTGLYSTIWVDKSYDLDHQYNRPLDRGIVERKIMYRLQGSSDWIYKIPNNLAPGAYELRYFVKDIENTWSDAFNLNFTLSNTPSVQFDCGLRALESSFGADSRIQGVNMTSKPIPASEWLEIFDAWSRYPNLVKLQMALYNGTVRVAPIKIVDYSALTGVKNGNDIVWNNISYQIPENLSDGQYKFKIWAEDLNNSAMKQEKLFDISVLTPINLKPEAPSKVEPQQAYALKAETTKYTSSVIVTMFSGTTWAEAINLSSTTTNNQKNWSKLYNIPANIPDGIYQASFTASTPNGNKEIKNLQFVVEGLKISSFEISGYWNHWRGQKDMKGNILSNEPHRFLSHEMVTLNIKTSGYADKIVIRFSPELEAMNFTDENGKVYKYEDYFNKRVLFPAAATFELDGTKNDNTLIWEYALPLAKSTKSWANARLRLPYKVTATVYRGTKFVTKEIDDIELTGNVYDLTYIQPMN